METFNNTIHFLLSQLYPNLTENDGWFQISQGNYSVKIEYSNIKFRLNPNFSRDINLVADNVLRCTELKDEFAYNHNGEISQITNFQSEIIHQITNDASENTLILRANYLCNCVVFLANYFNRAYTISQQNRI